jgi:hypothetical protein
LNNQRGPLSGDVLVTVRKEYSQVSPFLGQVKTPY